MRAQPRGPKELRDYLAKGAHDKAANESCTSEAEAVAATAALVDELFLVRSRAELFASAHVATVAGHLEERAGLVMQATQKGALLALAKRDIKSLTDDLNTCKAKSIELNGQVILNKEEVTLAGMY